LSHADRREIAEPVRAARESCGLTLATLDRIANALGGAMQVRFGATGGNR